MTCTLSTPLFRGKFILFVLAESFLASALLVAVCSKSNITFKVTRTGIGSEKIAYLQPDEKRAIIMNSLFWVKQAWDSQAWLYPKSWIYLSAYFCGNGATLLSSPQMCPRNYNSCIEKQHFVLKNFQVEIVCALAISMLNNNVFRVCEIDVGFLNFWLVKVQLHTSQSWFIHHL